MNEPNRRITAEEVKELVRRYAEQEHPKAWFKAAVLILFGEAGEEEPERLVIRPTPDPDRRPRE